MTADKEKRRAISREAAKKRRRVESDVFGNLSQLLPVQPSVQKSLDKPSIIRLTLSYIRMHTLLKDRNVENGHTLPPFAGLSDGGEEQRSSSDGGCGDVEPAQTEELKTVEETDMILSVLEGFLMVLTAHGDIIYLSDNVSKYMGLSQTELMGHNIFDFTHPCDHEEIRNNLRQMPGDVWCGEKRDFVMRIKSALTNRGRNSNLKSAMWKVLHCQGRLNGCAAPSSVPWLLLTCQPLPLSHTLLSSHTFTSQHSMDMRFTYCDHRVTVLLGYTSAELQGRSIYDLCHTLDTNSLSQNHLNLCWKSQSVSSQYRLLVRGGGYVWVETHSAVIPTIHPSRSRHRGSHQPLCILCVTYVLSGVEEPSLQLSVDQTFKRRFS
ncbi:endothelial PAS domain-containing protein 1 [Cynoglossus semilaevis]|uniref:endothelial PAS domain-containing protein 1 n=1 Tax=Cynoglossus semilaevis TaxID=244447 RepID=UPI0007DC9926|nr:endothelial PAS domain-containing protein 1 [Cynoglossus semilaevis]